MKDLKPLSRKFVRLGKCPGCGKLVELVFERNGYEQAFLSGLCCSNKCFNKYWKESLDYLKEKRN